MILFIVLFIIVILSTIVSGFVDEKVCKTLYLIVSFIILLYVTFRYEVGADWQYYQEIFFRSNWSYVIGNNKVEPLFVLFCIFIKSIGGCFYHISMILGALTVILFTKSIYDYSKYPLLSLSFFFVSFLILGVTQIRQGISLALLLYSIRFLLNKRYFLLFILMALAFGFHYSSVVFSGCLLLAQKRFSIKLSIWAFLSSLLLGLFLAHNNIGDYFISKITFGHIGYKLNAYSSEIPVPLFFQKTLYWRIVVTLIAFFIYNKKKSTMLLLSRNVYFIGLLFFILMHFIPVLSLRGSSYYKIFEVFILTEMIQYLYDKKMIKMLFITLLLSVGYYSRQLYYYYQNPDIAPYMQYRTVFSIKE